MFVEVSTDMCPTHRYEDFLDVIMSIVMHTYTHTKTNTKPSLTNTKH